jgi:hypothetical protein
MKALADEHAGQNSFQFYVSHNSTALKKQTLLPMAISTQTLYKNITKA